MANEKYTARTQFVPRRARSREYREAGITEARARQLISGGGAEISQRWDINNLIQQRAVLAKFSAQDATLKELGDTTVTIQDDLKKSNAKIERLTEDNKGFSETLTTLSYTVATQADIEKMCETAFV